MTDLKKVMSVNKKLIDDTIQEMKNNKELKGNDGGEEWQLNTQQEDGKQIVPEDPKKDGKEEEELKEKEIQDINL